MQEYKLISMKCTNLFLALLTILQLCSCKNSSENIKYYDADSKVINVKDKIQNLNILTQDKDISIFGTPYILNDYLIMSDYKSPDKLIHIFNKNTFKYITSVGDRGMGPKEIANMGRIATDERTNTFYVIDYGQQSILKYPIDSVLSTPNYAPNRDFIIEKHQFPNDFQYVNDTLSYALFIQLQPSKNDYRPVPAKWNMKTGEVVFMNYTGHPDIQRKRTSFFASVENGIYVEAYWHHDLLSICDLEGNLKYNLYGEHWNTKTSNDYRYYKDILFCKNRIVASYLGGKRLTKDNGEITSNYPDKLLFFDMEGNYVKRLDIGYPIFSMCYDSENNRLIFSLDDETQFGYLNLHDLL